MKRIHLAFLSAAAAGALMLAQAILAQQRDLATIVQAGETKQALERIRAGADVNHAQPDGTTPLIWAVNRADHEVVEALLARKADPNAVNEFGSMPLTEAARLNDDRMVRMLLDAGAKSDSANPDGETALMMAIKNGNLAMTETLIAAGANVNNIEKFHNQTPLIYASSAGRADIVKLLLSKGADVKPRALYTDWPSQVTSEPRTQYRPVGGLNALLYSARSGCYECAEMLLAAGADVNLPTPEGITPLMIALDNSNNDIAKLFIEKGASLHVWDWWGRTALWIAVDRKPAPGGGGGGGGFGGGQGKGGQGKGGQGKGGQGKGGQAKGGPAPRPSNRPAVSNDEIINTLLAAGADPNVEMNFHRPNAPGRGRFGDNQVSTSTTPLFRAIQLNDLGVAETLLKKGADPNINTMGYTPFLWAAGVLPSRAAGQVNMAALDLLTQYSADVNAKVTGTKTNSFALGYVETVNPSNTEGLSALHVAARSGNLNLVRFLLDKGANPDILDADGKKPIDVVGVPRASANQGKGAPAGKGGKGKGGPAGPSQVDLAEIRSLLQAASAK